MTIDAVAPNIGAVGFGTKRLSGKCSVSLRVARKIDKNAGEAAGIEIHRDRIPVSGFRDAGAVCQHVQAGKPENLKARVDPVCFRRRRRKRDAIEQECGCDRKTSKDHRWNHLIYFSPTYAPSAAVSALGSHYIAFPLCSGRVK